MNKPMGQSATSVRDLRALWGILVTVFAGFSLWHLFSWWRGRDSADEFLLPAAMLLWSLCMLTERAGLRRVMRIVSTLLLALALLFMILPVAS